MWLSLCPSFRLSGQTGGSSAYNPGFQIPLAGLLVMPRQGGSHSDLISLCILSTLSRPGCIGEVLDIFKASARLDIFVQKRN